jgi:hypothetical protein
MIIRLFAGEFSYTRFCNLEFLKIELCRAIFKNTEVTCKSFLVNKGNYFQYISLSLILQSIADVKTHKQLFDLRFVRKEVKF